MKWCTGCCLSLELAWSMVMESSNQQFQIIFEFQGSTAQSLLQNKGRSYLSFKDLLLNLFSRTKELTMPKKDKAWQYGTQMPGPTPGVVYCKCNFCNLPISGGVGRLKNHLAGTHKDIKECPLVTKEVKEEIQASLRVGLKNKEMKERLEAEAVDLSDYERLHAGGSGQESISTRGARGPIDRMLMAYNIASETGTNPAPRFSAAELKDVAYRAIARFFYENGIAFHAADSESFREMLKTVGRYGPDLPPPSAHDVGNRLLNEAKKETEIEVERIKKKWPETGVTIVSDGWKDIRGRQLINFLANSPDGTVFLKTVDASDKVKTGELLFEMLDEVVEEVGEDLVVQVVTDNASNYVNAGGRLMEKRKKLWWTPCAAHCLDLMLESIGKLPQHATALRKAKKVTNFIYNHSWVHALMREHCPKEILRPAATRFGTAYLTLESMMELRQPLQGMFSSLKWCQSSYAKKAEGKTVKKYILDDGGF